MDGFLGSDDWLALKTLQSGPDKSRAYRRQQKALRKELHRQEAALRQELAALRLWKKEESATFDAAQSQSFLLFRDVAERLREERRIAEHRQQQLTRLINNQTIYIKTIRGIVGKRISTAMALVRKGPPRQRIGKPSGPESYALCLQELDMNFQITNEIFRAYDALFIRDANSVHKQVTNGEVNYFSTGTRIVLPMSPVESMKFLWEFGAQLYSTNEGFVRFKSVHNPDNTRIESFIESSVLQSGRQVKVQQHFLLRRFQVDNQVFVTWQFISEGMGDFNGLRTDENGWCKLEPSSSPTEPGTAVNLCICRTPTPSTEATLDKSEVNDFHEVMRRISTKTLDNVVTSAETALLRNLVEEME